jgi:hypothetical protein
MDSATIVEITIKGGTKAQVEGVHSLIAKLIGNNSAGAAAGYPVETRERDDQARVEVTRGFLRAFVLAFADGSFPYPLPGSGLEQTAISVNSIETGFESGLAFLRITGRNLERIDGVDLADAGEVSIVYDSLTATAVEIRLTDWRYENHPPYPAETAFRLRLKIAGDVVFTTSQTLNHQEPN